MSPGVKCNEYNFKKPIDNLTLNQSNGVYYYEVGPHLLLQS